MQSGDYSIGVWRDPAAVPAAEWNMLLDHQAQPTPFMRHEFLAALHASGCAAEDSGWEPAFVTLHRNACLVGATAAWRKRHSWGEYVFDWAWAEAHQRHGLPYYPKLSIGVPFTPVPGSRLLATDADARAALLAALQRLAEAQGLSSAHLLFGDDTDLAAARQAGWLLRRGVQFHWRNRAGTHWPDWTAYLASLQRDKRKKIQQERRRVAGAGIRFRVLEGAQIGPAEWDYFHHCYACTYRAHGQAPYLSREFFTAVGGALAAHWLMFVALRGETPVAVSLLGIDRAHGAAWGRYWGATEAVPCLHFEACYYQPLQWCIEQRFTRFEGGAQGEHKMARGLLPVETASAHWVAHPAFREAIARFVEREGHGMAAYLDELGERNPFKAAPAGSG